jgi:hypothetical protein
VATSELQCAIRPGPQFLVVEGVVQTLHRRRVDDRRERGGERSTHRAGRRRLLRELGMRLLQSPQLADQRVELGVGDLWGVVQVVALGVVGDQRTERLRPGCGILRHATTAEPRTTSGSVGS